MSRRPTVVALAGRRIDAPDAKVERFPLPRVRLVAGRLRIVLGALHCTTLVTSAANGADLVALHVARERGIRVRIVLPFGVARFRTTSVVDRPGNELWGWLFDDLVAAARAAGDLIVLSARGRSDQQAFEAANERIIAEAIALAGRGRRTRAVAGVAVWEGTSRGDGDATEAFVARMRASGLPVHRVPLDDRSRE
jgi:hypothetical protein